MCMTLVPVCVCVCVYDVREDYSIPDSEVDRQSDMFK